MGWGWYWRSVIIPAGKPEQVIIRWVPIKRFYCKQCGQTFGVLPPFLVILKRHAAPLIQGCWEDWCAGDTYEKLSEKWWIRCVRTVQRWLRPLIRNQTSLLAELRRLWQLEELQQTGALQERFKLLQAVRQAIQQSRPSKIRRATPYFHVQLILHALRLS